MTEDQYQHWKDVRARGHTRYILLHGILMQGLTFGIFMAIADIIWPSHAFSVTHCAFIVAFAATIFGYLSGQLAWHRNEKAFEIQKRHDDGMAS